jgi:hypothetical protein
VDQVGVKAPGRPTSTIFFFVHKSFVAIFVGGKPWSKNASGRTSPTFIAPTDVNAAAHASRTRLAMVPLLEDATGD